MSHFFVSISNICNLNCPMCKSQDYPEKKRFMPLALFRKLASAIAVGYPSCHLAFHTTNEPILHPEIVDILNYTEELNLFNTISSNGQALDRFIDRLDRAEKKPKVLRFRYSIDGGTRETYEIMRHKGSFDRLRANLAAIQAYSDAHGIRYSSEVNYILTKQTAKELYSFLLEFADHFTLDTLSLSFLSAHSFTGINTFIRENSIFPLVNRITHAKCLSLETSLTVFENGDAGCCFEHREDDSVLVGNLLDVGISEIMQAPRRKAYIDAAERAKLDELPASCARCFISSKCVDHAAFRAKAAPIFDRLKADGASRERGNEALYDCLMQSVVDVG
jgi:radical SAM protein with 4Fe4S-binding SPASM domain